MALNEIKQDLEEILESGANAVTSLRKIQWKLAGKRERKYLKKFGKRFAGEWELQELISGAKQDVSMFYKTLNSMTVPQELKKDVHVFELFGFFFLDGPYDYSEMDAIQEQIASAIQMIDEMCIKLEAYYKMDYY